VSSFGGNANAPGSDFVAGLTRGILMDADPGMIGGSYGNDGDYVDGGNYYRNDG
jgi:hypothetical protein